MKQSSWMVVSVALLLAGAPAVGANVLTNGDFSGGTGGTWAPGAAQGATDSVPTGWVGFDTADQALRVAGTDPAVIFNAGNKPTVNWIQQAVSTVPRQWYTVAWDHEDGPGVYPARAVSSVHVWNGTSTAGAPDLGDRWSAYPTGNLRQVFQAGSAQATVRFSDKGSNSTSNDTQIDNASLDLAGGAINIAPSLGVATASSAHGSFGKDPQGAIDGSGNYGEGITNYHSAGSADQWWRADLSQPAAVSRVEIRARNGFDSRNGDFLDLIDAGGNVISTSPIPDQALWSLDGGWTLSAVQIRTSSGATQPLNLAEVRLFSDFEAGKMLAPNLLKNGDFSRGTAGTWVSGSATGGGNAVPTDWRGYATAGSALKVSGEQVIFNAANKPAGSYVEQTVGTEGGKWYVLQWDHENGPGGYPDRAVSTANVWDGATAAGAPDLVDRSVRYPTLGIQHLFHAASGQATVRFSDVGSNSTSNDTQIDTASLRLADGTYNIAPSLGIASASSTHGSFGTNPQQAVDGSSNYSDGRTNFHSGGIANEWWRLDFTELARLTRVEIQARSGYNHRNGEFIDFLDPEGNVIDTLSIANGALWSVDGSWIVSAIEIRNGPNASQTLNLAEVRAFATFEDGQIVIPEPVTAVLWAFGSLCLGRYGWRRRRAQRRSQRSTQ